MANRKVAVGHADSQVPVKYVDNGDGTFSEQFAAALTATIGALAMADGNDVAQGALADAIVAAGAAGSPSAKLRRATQGLEDLKTLIVLAAGTHLIGKVGLDQTTPGVTNGVALTNDHVATAALTNASANVADAVILAANAARRGAIITNDSTAILYIAFGAVASPTAYTVALAGTGGGVAATFILPQPCYTGAIHGLWASANGAARITELA